MQLRGPRHLSHNILSVPVTGLTFVQFPLHEEAGGVGDPPEIGEENRTSNKVESYPLRVNCLYFSTVAPVYCQFEVHIPTTPRNPLGDVKSIRTYTWPRGT